MRTREKSDVIRAKMQPFYKKFSVKNVKTGFGHDLQGCYFDVSMGRNKVGYFNDDGWGGETDIQLTDEARKELEEMCTTEGIAEFMYNNGWDFMDNVEKISLNHQVEYVLDELLNEKELTKAENKVKKDMEKGIVYAKTKDYLYSFNPGMGIWKFGKHKLKDVIQAKGVDWVTKQIKEKFLPELEKNGEIIVNTNLEELGIVL